MSDRLADLEATKKVRLPCMRGECRPMDWCERCRYIVKIEAALTELVKIARSQKTALQDVQAVALNGAAPGLDPLDVIDEIADNALFALAAPPSPEEPTA